MPTDVKTIDIEKHYDRVILDLEKLISEKEKLVNERFDTVYTIMAHDKEAIEEARKLALDASNKHFESLNGAAKVQQDFKDTYVSKNVYDPKIDRIEDAIRRLESLTSKFSDGVEDRKARDAKISTWLLALTGSFIVTLLGFVLNYFFGR